MKTVEIDHVIMGAGIVGIWLARRLLSMGRSVALVEIGSAESQASQAAAPIVHFAERENIGVTSARNHTLTGNSKYWGGGLMRNDAQSVCRMFNLESSSNVLNEFAACYEFVEKQLAMPPTARVSQEENVRIAKISVLPGKYRNVASTLLRPFLGSQQLNVFCNAEIVNLDYGFGNRITAIEVSSADGDLAILSGRNYVLSMGVVDSNIFALTKLLPKLRKSDHLLGRHLHDHWSIPIAKIKWKNNAGLDWLYPPAFRGNYIQGVHAEIDADCPWGPQAGFLHLQAQYDQVEPYATIKRILSARQRGLGLGAQIQSTFPLLGHIRGLSNIAYHRYVRQRLFVPDGMEISCYLDFEAFPSEKNRFAIENGIAKLYWDIREEDVSAFTSLVAKSNALIRRWSNSMSSQVELLVDERSNAKLEAYLRAQVVDAFHLGGGLAVGAASTQCVLKQDFRFSDIPNLAAIGTATFATSGVANPVETLLAMCERYARSVA